MAKQPTQLPPGDAADAASKGKPKESEFNEANHDKDAASESEGKSDKDD